MQKNYTFTVIKPGSRLDSYLTHSTGESREFVQKQIRQERISVNGTVITKAGQRLKQGDAIKATFVTDPLPDLTPEEGNLDILFEDEYLIALNKPQGLVVHPAAGHQTQTLVHYLLHYLEHHTPFREMEENRPGIVHRLDKGTSGLILIAKDRKTQEALSKLFKSRDITKRYECIVWGKTLMEGRIEGAIGRHPVHRKKMSTKTRQGREALTDWKQMSGFNHFSHMEIKPHTGRTHQIRVHLSENGNPIVGDSLYGKAINRSVRKGLDQRITEFVSATEHPFLHAKALELIHPRTEKKLKLSAPRPEAFNKFLSLLKMLDTQ